MWHKYKKTKQKEYIQKEKLHFKSYILRVVWTFKIILI